MDGEASGASLWTLGGAIREIERLRAEIADIKERQFPDRIEKVSAGWRARIAEMEAERAWRPIASAPRDGTRILLLNTGGDGEDESRRVAEGSWGQWNPSEYLWCMEAGDGWMSPTAWQPLPLPPTPEGE